MSLREGYSKAIFGMGELKPSDSQQSRNSTETLATFLSEESKSANKWAGCNLGCNQSHVGKLEGAVENLLFYSQADAISIFE